MTHILQIVWPIIDETRTRQQLLDEATDQLDDYADQAHCIITGPPLWLITQAADTPGWHAYTPGSLLVALMPAERYGSVHEQRHLGVGEPDHAAVWRAVHHGDPSGLRRYVDRRTVVAELTARDASAGQISELLGVNRRAVQDVRHRNHINPPSRDRAA